MSLVVFVLVVVFVLGMPHVALRLPCRRRVGRAVLGAVRALWIPTATVGLYGVMAQGLFAADSLRVAALTTEYTHNSHADVIVGRMLESYSLDGKGEFPRLQVASLFVDQFPDGDKARRLAERHQVELYNSPSQTLTLGGDQLAVDGVFLVAEHGRYPKSDTGQVLYPKRKMFADIAAACRKSRRGVPVFVDKHLADNWDDARWIYDEATRCKVPLMAGSSLPGTWRFPPVDVERGQALKEIVAISYGNLETYGLHALEIVQCLVERRRGGETGVKQVRTFVDDAVWKAIDEGAIDPSLLKRVLAQSKDRPIPRDKPLAELVKRPALFLIDYHDGLRASVLTFRDRYCEWSAAWSYADGRTQGSVFWTQEKRPYSHFALLVQNLEPFFQTGKPTWPVQRTLLTTGILNALHISHRDGGRMVKTPHLKIAYESDWNWKQPPEPYASRPKHGP